MKRATLSFLALAGVVLCAFFLRRALQNSPPATMADEEAPAEPREEGESRLQAGSGDPQPAEIGDPPRSVSENQAPAPPGPGAERVNAAEAAGASTEGGGASESSEALPLKRYQDDDALATRRARQIELVSEARRQARASLEAAEERGDTEVAARTRGVLRRLQLRLDALEAAASAVEPY